jgi:hypothetical protein
VHAWSGFRGTVNSVSRPEIRYASGLYRLRWLDLRPHRSFSETRSSCNPRVDDGIEGEVAHMNSTLHSPRQDLHQTLSLRLSSQNAAESHLGAVPHRFELRVATADIRVAAWT